MNDYRERMLLRSRVRACLSGVMIGDALGAHCEGATHDEILAANGGPITDFGCPIIAKFSGAEKLPQGVGTDDWQATRAVLFSLVNGRGFNFRNMAEEHIREFHLSSVGWGTTTRNSILEFEKFLDSLGKEGRNPETPAMNSGCGNGVAMKVAPLAMMHVFRTRELLNVDNDPYRELFSDVMKLGQMTHGDVRASVAAFAVAMIIAKVLQTPFTPEVHRDEEWANLIEVGDIERFFDDLFEKVWFAEMSLHRVGQPARGYQMDYDSFAVKLKKLKEIGLSHLPTLRREIGTNCFSLESVPLAIAIFLRNPTNFEAGVLEAVNSGGDTDSIASMVGAMIGANVGLHGIPEKWLYFSRDFFEAIELADEFFDEFCPVDSE